MKRRLIVLLLLCLGACERHAAPTEASVPVEDTSADSAGNVASTNNAIKLTVSPSRMTQCDPAVEAVVQWDASAIPAITTIEIWAGDGSDFKLFAAGGVEGEAKTGPWTRPGSRFRVIEPSSKRVLAELRVAGPQC
ncbi:hypothetical protein [Pseudoxanthomonas sp. CF125]|uniref:hypothetical protein n=1 Tax=Pseudoxanthomonas sp. CF125 TaxID=1855303 RepID=UPI0008857856|nr:hypothetical protein [Pseudoxanthomonas sp. CF125]SDQ88953.1 hypothetical protein SAMN05216569_2447 [Pseudoxanthomonas sp. CF125]